MFFRWIAGRVVGTSRLVVLVSFIKLVLYFVL